ncbi:alpha-mannosidase [Paenibacillus mendelii]|uniref:Alpha-mannosidase n=1 Tax=Paenibacillus mendelii TaxID=206163 RepID=A0ABV6J9G6_9BACL|nr:glycosyl hydrolase-related protein [Paenibacillus mendelii]MCQ6559521.1 glycosyl hydrolase-related protein [Paenibacillus mendelii]
MTTNKTYHFISHTHWDREWYLPLERFRYRLVNLIDRLLALLDRDPDFRYFHLDGQTIVLEDYYALRPGNRERLEAYIKQGRILIGPWYQQNDLYLTSGESTVRNLMTGIKDSRRLGGEMKVGYLPDHFGLIGQMPQIFQEVGLDNCVFGRGYDMAKHKLPFFRWQAPDGSAVDGMLLYYWYNSAQRLPSDGEQLRSVFAGMREREEAINPSPHHAMMNGVDHLEAQYDLSEVLAKLREQSEGEIEIVHSRLTDFVQGVQSYMQDQQDGVLETVEGELRECFEYSILSGTLSSRIYLKQANAHCHDLVEKWIEPLSVFCRVADLDGYETDTIDYFWKLYMENHPHDSICGCSQDSVHDHMMDRYTRLKELAEEIIDRKMKAVAKQVSAERFGQDDQKLVVFNTSQLRSSAVVRMPVYFLEEDQVADFALLDDAGQPIPYQIVSERLSRIQVLSPINLPGVLKVKRFDIEWQPGAPALGYATYQIRPHSHGAIARNLPEQTSQHPILENDLLKVELQADGSFHLHDKSTGVVYHNQGRLQDAGDGGDLYVFKNVEGDTPALWQEAVSFTSLTRNELYEECVYEFTWELPESLDHTKRRRTDAKKSSLFRVSLRLDRTASEVKMAVEIDNQVKDHRLRLLFKGASQAKEVLAGGQFDAVKRAWNEGSEFQRDAHSQPFWKWVAPRYEEGGIAVYAKGLYEYEMTEQGRTIGITILRGVETINMREEVELEEDRQPKGQCLGASTVELSVRPFSLESITQLYQEAELFHQGVKTKLYPMDQERWTRGRAWVQDTAHKGLFKEEDPNTDKPSLPLRKSFMEVDGEVMLSAWKWSEDGERPVLRIYNVEDATSRVTVTADGLHGEIIAANLLEEPCGTIAVQSGRFDAEVEAKKIKTYLM